MDTTKLMPAAITVAIAYGIMHFVKNPLIKAAAAGVIGVAAAKQIPYLNSGL